MISCDLRDLSMGDPMDTHPLPGGGAARARGCYQTRKGIAQKDAEILAIVHFSLTSPSYNNIL